MKMHQGQIWPTVDGKAALIVFDEGCCLVAQKIDEAEWLVCALPEAMSVEIRSRKGDLSIREFRDGDDIAIVVTINREDLAFCSTAQAEQFLAQKPKMLFAGPATE